MKSKPPNKKIKVEVIPLGPPVPDPPKTTTPSISPAGSTTSTTSSLLSIGPPPYTARNTDVTCRTTPVVGGVGKSNAKSKGAAAVAAAAAAAAAAASAAIANAKAAEAAAAAASAAASQNVLAFPLLTHFNLLEFPKINMCITMLGAKPGGVGQPSGNTGTVPTGDAANKPQDTLNMDDIDLLQGELETLWSSVASRIRLLHKEKGIIQTTPTTTTHHHHSLALDPHFDPQHQEKIAAVATIIDHGTRTSVSAAAKLVMQSQLSTTVSPVPSPVPPPVVTPTPKRTVKVTQSKKKLKGETGGKSKKSAGGGDKQTPGGARATQNRSHSVSSDLGVEAPGVGGLVHEVPTQFWDSVDGFCKEITKEEVDELAKVVDEQKKLAKSTLEIPALGKYFKPEEDDIVKLRARESRINSTKDIVGPLTQRLVSALVEERVYNYHLNSPSEDASLATPQEAYFINRPGLVKTLGLDGSGGANTPSLENRIRECLVDQGLLLPDDVNSDPLLLNPDDEVLAEIKRTQCVFNKLHQYNGEKLSALLNIGRKEMERQMLKRDLEKADKDVLDAYKSVAACRIKKKPITKKEKEAATKALEARKKALIKLGPNKNSLPGSSSMTGSGHQDMTLSSF